MMDMAPDGSLLFADPAAERVTIEHTQGGVRVERGSQRWFFPTNRALKAREEQTLGRLVAQWRAQMGML